MDSENETCDSITWLGVSFSVARLCDFSKIFTRTYKTLCCPHMLKSGQSKTIKEGSTILATAEPLEIALLYVRVRNSSDIEEHNELGATGSSSRKLSIILALTMSS